MREEKKRFKKGTKVIGAYTYQDNFYITSVRIPEGVRSINSCAFNRCIFLSDLKLPVGSIRSIGRMAFACTSLTEITIPDSVELIDELAFAFNSDLRSVHIGRGVKRIMPGAFSGCTRLDKITIDCENDNYYVHNGCLIEKNSQKLVLIAAPYVVANDVKIIEKQTFVSLVYCESITIPESVEHICMDGDSLANFSMCVYTEYEGETEWSTRPFVIRASHGSYAERFAREHNFCFEEI